MQALDGFLESVLWELFRNSRGRIGPYALSGFLPSTVLDHLPDPTTVADAVALSRRMNSVDSSVSLLIQTLNRDWYRIKPERKSAIIGYIRQHGLEHQFDPRMLRLSASDEEALQIRWDISDMLYAEEREKAFLELKEKGIDLPSGDGPGLVSPSLRQGLFDSVMRLLRTKIDFDLAVVTIAVRNARDRYGSEIRDRCFSEYLDTLGVLRATLERAFSEWQILQGLNSLGVPEHVQKLLDPFILRAQALVKRVPNLTANQELYRRAQELARDTGNQNKNITYIGALTMEDIKFKITGGQQGSVGDNNQVNHFVQQQTVGTPIDIPDMAALAEELLKLKTEAQKRAVSGKELRAAAELADAEEAAKEGNGELVIQKLKSAGEWALGIAKEIGASVAAKVVAHSLGLPG